MGNSHFYDFLQSNDTLRIYEDSRLIFSSTKDRLLPILEYIEQFPKRNSVIILDKIVGNAAALLAVKARAKEVDSPIGSRMAITTLEKYGVQFHISDTVPYIQKDDVGVEICPMEKLSFNKDPEEFYSILLNLMRSSGGLALST
jgi:hypothetical protein